MKGDIGKVFLAHFENNFTKYFFLIFIFSVGICIGSISLSYININTQNNISEYITSFLNHVKNRQISLNNLFIESFINNIKIIFIVWLFGTTIMGLPIIFALIGFKGFSIGLSVAYFIKVMGIAKGLTFALISIVPQNIILIPCIIALGVSGINFSRSLYNDSTRYKNQSIKNNLFAHTVLASIILLLCFSSSLLESYINTIFINLFCKYL